MKGDVYGISRAVWPWKSPDSVEEEGRRGRPVFRKMEYVAVREYPVCAQCRLSECRDWHPMCQLRKEGQK